MNSPYGAPVPLVPAARSIRLLRRIRATIAARILRNGRIYRANVTGGTSGAPAIASGMRPRAEGDRGRRAIAGGGRSRGECLEGVRRGGVSAAADAAAAVGVAPFGAGGRLGARGWRGPAGGRRGPAGGWR